LSRERERERERGRGRGRETVTTHSGVNGIGMDERQLKAGKKERLSCKGLNH